MNPRPISPSGGPLLPRLLNAVLLRRSFYDAVAADTRATGPAGAVVCLAAIARESVALYQLSEASQGWGLILALIVVFAILRWLLYASVMYPIARGLSSQPVEFKRLLRCLGFAETPAVISLVGFLVDDSLFPYVQFGVGVWLLLATIVAVRSATGERTRRAILIGVLGFAAYLAIGVASDIALHGPQAAPSA